jgi:hypothetical protein
MTRRFKSLVLDGVSHMIDDPQGDWVRWCDCRDVEGELSRLREGMPSMELLNEFDRSLRFRIVSSENHLECVFKWLRRLAAGGEK